MDTTNIAEKLCPSQPSYMPLNQYWDQQYFPLKGLAGPHHSGSPNYPLGDYPRAEPSPPPQTPKRLLHPGHPYTLGTRTRNPIFSNPPSSKAKMRSAFHISNEARKVYYVKDQVQNDDNEK